MILGGFLMKGRLRLTLKPFEGSLLDAPSGAREEGQASAQRTPRGVESRSRTSLPFRGNSPEGAQTASQLGSCPRAQATAPTTDSRLSRARLAHRSRGIHLIMWVSSLPTSTSLHASRGMPLHEITPHLSVTGNSPHTPQPAMRRSLMPRMTPAHTHSRRSPGCRRNYAP
jgi:hypothetical protein